MEEETPRPAWHSRGESWWNREGRREPSSSCRRSPPLSLPRPRVVGEWPLPAAPSMPLKAALCDEATTAGNDPGPRARALVQRSSQVQVGQTRRAPHKLFNFVGQMIHSEPPRTGNAPGAVAFLNVLCAPQEPVNRYPQPRLPFPQPSKEHPTSRDGGRAPLPTAPVIWRSRPRAVGVVACGHPPTGPPPPGTNRSIEPERCARNCRTKPSAGMRRGWH